MELIYQLNAGDRFRIYSADEFNGSVFQVERLVGEVALCVNTETQSVLMLPMAYPMPFAMMMLKGIPQPKPVKAVILTEAPAAVPVKPEAETDPESPAVPAEAASENKTEDQPAEEEAPQEPIRLTATIEYYNIAGNWGKLSHEHLKGGMFFHASQVEDDELRTYLSTLPAGSTCPKLAVSYMECVNPHRGYSPCGGFIRAEEPLPEQPVPTETRMSGYLWRNSLSDERGQVSIVNDDQRLFFTYNDVDDPFLLCYLKEQVPDGEVDGMNISITFRRLGNHATHVVWGETDFDKDTLAEKLDETEKANWEESGDRHGTPENPAEPRPVPTFVAMPLRTARHSYQGFRSRNR